MSVSDTYAKWRYRYVPDHLLGEVLSKNWIDNAIPFAFLLIVVGLFGSLIPGFLSPAGFSDLARQLGEVALISIGLGLVMLAGGIDLSVGSTFAMANFVSLALINSLGWPVWAVVPAVLCVGALIGLMNGILIGYLRLRAFLTTLATLIIVRAMVDLLILSYAREVAMSMTMSEAWFYLGEGFILGIPVNFLLLVAVAILVHLVLSRMRFGWHILAVGGSRRSAYNAGISVRRTVCATYVISGVMAAMAGIFYAARLGSVGPDTGIGLEVTVLTACVLGGISLGGGRGSVFKAFIGTVIVLMVTNSLIRLNMPSGSTPLVLGMLLLLAVAVDIRWVKNRHKLLSRVYVSPTYFDLPEDPSANVDATSSYALNDKFRDVTAIGLGDLDGPEDMIFDSNDNLYTGGRQGDIVRFFAPDYTRSEVFVHLGGFPLGLAMDKDDNLHACVAGMGLYMVTPEREIKCLSDETNRSLFSIIDDSRIRMADDLDIAADGRVYFSEATIRYGVSDWAVDALEARGNGRILAYDPKDGSTRTVLSGRVFPNGICMVDDGESLLFAETWACRISRFWFAGPRKGQVEPVIEDIPGYPDNINRASDGTYWVALAGMRSPAFDLSLKMPGFRKRMAQRVAMDEWLYPNLNTGCVLKMTLDGTVTESLWDLSGEAHPQITSIREHKGALYLGGINNNRIGRYELPEADQTWTSQNDYWGRT
ncbi:SMP-30/gluconolactonase/LRE family protein [uncultured Celeribacter sp.]|uniref:ABC transporter permease n=1 Tax=uncultured Celeribacter sp. TaxID=1303376 RepID=UPI002AA62A4B|nr:SMP-30/gluconolactonase/LRE family protein [uncultured Celeribacter sp.]